MTFRAIKIDVEKKEVVEIELPAGGGNYWLRELYKQMDASFFCQVGRKMQNNDTLLVDDNGLLEIEKKKGAFSFGAYPQVLVGNGIITGNTHSGDYDDAKSEIEWVKSMVSWEKIELAPKPFIEVIPVDNFEDAMKILAKK